LSFQVWLSRIVVKVRLYTIQIVANPVENDLLDWALSSQVIPGAVTRITSRFHLYHIASQGSTSVNVFAGTG
jgi:hypothetical protein